MPFIAKLASTGERIDITSITDIRENYKPDDFLCPLCNNPLTVRRAHKRQNAYIIQHFMHRSNCDSNYDAHPESAEHLYGKLFIKKTLDHWYKRYDVDIELECPIDMDWRPRGRIADIMVTYPMGWREIHEIQLSPITPALLQERTNDYLQCGIDVTWWLGKSADTEANRSWCAEYFGESYSIQFAHYDASPVILAQTGS